MTRLTSNLARPMMIAIGRGFGDPPRPRRRLPQLLRPPLWPALAAGAAALAVLALLLAFHQVVSAGVERGELRRQSSTAQANANWRCNTMGDAARRTDCRLLLSPPPHDAVVALIAH